MEQFEAIRHGLGELHRIGARLGLAAKRQEPARELRRPLRHLGNDHDFLLQLGIAAPIHLDFTHLEDHGGQQVVELVGDTADQFAHRAQLPGLRDLRVHQLARRDILREHAEMRRPAAGGQGDERHLEHAPRLPELIFVVHDFAAGRPPAQHVLKMTAGTFRQRQFRQEAIDGRARLDGVEPAGLAVHGDEARPHGLHFDHRHSHGDIVVQRLQERPLAGELLGLPADALAQRTLPEGPPQRRDQSEGQRRDRVDDELLMGEKGRVDPAEPFAIDPVVFACAMNDRETFVELGQELGVALVDGAGMPDFMVLHRIAEGGHALDMGVINDAERGEPRKERARAFAGRDLAQRLFRRGGVKNLHVEMVLGEKGLALAATADDGERFALEILEPLHGAAFADEDAALQREIGHGEIRDVFARRRISEGLQAVERPQDETRLDLAALRGFPAHA